ncbi:MAG: tRNA (adenosine(37)-N6)-threonylcarbamoyltransferase complex ATPase subunit type 1 TsaE [Spirochaetales bacterium]|nr:tRNA (adenosine(37)-N6)-threonylcarbamoyltransferase complex ATPase subunit type 1 TsaE [Spirochaetales bacterium]MBR6199634.1 tRNA (adenosine(37)-N6)-threonylcarbamoyltransferase complex ATPase subunit type 1 TsaE [Spirochaetales bacterium]
MNKCSRYITHSEEETYRLGMTLSERFNGGDVVLLEGELGVGKSVFIRGVADAKGITEPMPSPTFTIVNQYVSPSNGVTINHFDFYRINDPFELYEIGFEEYIYADGSISFIEWPSKGEELLPKDVIRIGITIDEHNDRIIEIDWGS